MYLFPNLYKCVLLIFSHILSLLLLLFLRLSLYLSTFHCRITKLEGSVYCIVLLLLSLNALWSKHTVYRTVTTVTICVVTTVLTTVMVGASISTGDTNEGQGCTKCIETSTRLQNYYVQGTMH
jgi:hypothetical protein